MLQDFSEVCLLFAKIHVRLNKAGSLTSRSILLLLWTSTSTLQGCFPKENICFLGWFIKRSRKVKLRNSCFSCAPASGVYGELIITWHWALIMALVQGTAFMGLYPCGILTQIDKDLRHGAIVNLWDVTGECDNWEQEWIGEAWRTSLGRSIIACLRTMAGPTAGEVGKERLTHCCRLDVPAGPRDFNTRELWVSFYWFIHAQRFIGAD